MVPVGSEAVVANLVADAGGGQRGAVSQRHACESGRAAVAVGVAVRAAAAALLPLYNAH